MGSTRSRHHNAGQGRTVTSPGDQSSASVGSGHRGPVFFPWGACTWFVSHLLCSHFRLCPSCYMLLVTLNSTWSLRPTRVTLSSTQACPTAQHRPMPTSLVHKLPRAINTGREQRLARSTGESTWTLTNGKRAGFE